MTTKEHYILPLPNGHQQVSVGFNNDDAQYNNLNLNQNSKWPKNDEIVKSKTTPKSDGKVLNDDQVDDDHKKENNGSSDDASQRLHSFRYSNILRSGKQQPATAVVKKPSTKTNSTLSLHINAYENSNEASGGDSNDKFRFGRSRNSKTFNKIRNSVKQYFGKSSFLTIPFEIPRQQDDPLNSTPEIMEFKASQKLLNPNKVEADISEENEPKDTDEKELNDLKDDENAEKTEKNEKSTQMTVTIDEEQKPKPAKGLSNLGNTCFYNSVMQSLMHTHALYSWQEKVTDEKVLTIKKNSVVINEKTVEVPAAVITLKETTSLPLVSALQHFLAEFRVGRGPNPSPLFSQIAVKAPRFRGWAQQDAHELLRYLLDGIRTEELKRFKEAIFEHLGVDDKPTPEQTLMCKAMLESTDRCYIDSIFAGSLLQVIACSKCKHMSNSLEPFLDLSLPLNYGAPSTPTVQVFFPPPNNRREGTPSKHQIKKMKKKERREAKEAAKKKKNVAPVENGNNGESLPPPLLPSADETNATTAASADPIDDIKAIDDNSDTDDASSAEDMSISDNEEENGNLIDETNETLENPKSCSSPNYVAVLSPQPPEENADEARTVINSLKHFTAPENLCASNAYECENCCAPHNKTLPPNSKDKMTVEATKRYLIYSPPSVLTVHLKRFEQVPMNTWGNRMRTRKIRGHVEFPFVLNMAPFCSRIGQRVRQGQQEVIYSLYGIVSHSGDLGGGHYVAYVKSRNKVEELKQFMEAGMKPDRLCQTMEKLNNETEQQEQQLKASALNKEEILQKLDENATWYYASDSHVRQINVSEVKNAEAYILFYERII